MKMDEKVNPTSAGEEVVKVLAALVKNCRVHLLPKDLYNIRLALHDAEQLLSAEPASPPPSARPAPLAERVHPNLFRFEHVCGNVVYFQAGQRTIPCRCGTVLYKLLAAPSSTEGEEKMPEFRHNHPEFEAALTTVDGFRSDAGNLDTVHRAQRDCTFFDSMEDGQAYKDARTAAWHIPSRAKFKIS